MSKSNKYDTIIGNLRKEFQDSMSKSQINKWEVPKYSKSQVNKAGKSILEKLPPVERFRMNKIVHNWRAAHDYPMHEIASELSQIVEDGIVVQRLKRMESIVGKLIRNPSMQLYRMQDLGGCRVIVDAIADVYKSIERYESTTPNILKRKVDYIKNPKASGYRSYHMICQYQNAQFDTYNKMLIEIQFRTKLQHMWATAVEMMGIYTGDNLKSGQGDKGILRFFTLVSSLFAFEEDAPTCPGTSDLKEGLSDEIRKLDQNHDVIKKLMSLNNALQIAQEYSDLDKDGYYLLTLHLKENNLRIDSFKKEEHNIAIQAYNEMEQNMEPDTDMVLVSARSFDSLQKAYPNYFVDISDFITQLNNILFRYNYYFNKYRMDR